MSVSQQLPAVEKTNMVCDNEGVHVVLLDNFKVKEDESFICLHRGVSNRINRTHKLAAHSL